ncbi:LysR family transcriptional regulator [Serratia ficaria]|jgi:DNA-binding transcriptional LysR family regulator|uniref:Cyn operon transcriptional activator n=1 Tax=Serratia ficaria TaxID=61651 RepID=A0A240AJD1_SERFI|nr:MULTISPECIES: LysR family transcriptional regulator [Serratia]MEE4482830.1 LysR family transcriptional regulator [Serratia ficaria]REF42854.1 DNA-binding transcriptional LysR family regulator [Serratia ficaria]CAI0935550.1 Cyn operon transcriptional activator [Serratia ficaria]CAI1175446.1 Cyn operon transcriptional activator [Serratia ficaria]CAI1177898.1 Cyn operon transcriptional activator [Serratia ficaria]
MYQDRQVGYLYEVGNQGGIRRAADILGVNPSVISRQIAQLERALQLPLLERRGRNVVLTEAGRLLAEDHFTSRQRREKLESQLKDLRHMRGGTISVRIGGGLISAFIEGVMREFARSYPQVFVDIVVGSMQEMLNDIVSGEADMALAFGPIGTPELKRHSVQWGPICAVVSPQHPIAGRSSITIEELVDYQLIALTENFGLQRHMNAMFKSLGLQFHPAYRCNQFSTAMGLSQAGLGISFMTAYAAADPVRQGSLVAVPLDHPIASSAQCHLLRSSDRRFTPAAHHMWRLLHNAFRDR